MAASRPVPSRPTPPRLSGPPRPGSPAPAGHRSAPSETVLDADSTRVEGPHAVRSRAPERAAAEGKAAATAAAAPRRIPERSRAEKNLLLVLLLGCGVNLGAFLVEGGDLDRGDLLFAGVTFFAGLALLALAEICRRTGNSPAGSEPARRKHEPDRIGHQG